MTRISCSVFVVAAFVMAASSGGTAIAQAYPVKPIRLIVPFPPGGGFDAIGRPYAERLGPALGQTIIVDNRPGASGNIGAMAAAKSAPDGYTLLLGNDFMPLNVVLSANLGYDAVADFSPISLVGTVPNVLVINPALPARDLKQLMAASHSKALNFGSAAPGSVGHLLGELLNMENIVKMVHIPYKGSAPAVTDTVGGTLDAVITTLPSVSAFVRAGKLRAIGTFSARRSPAMPDMPTIAEAGGPTATGDVWYGVFAPAATPEAVIRRLNDATVMVLKQPELIEALRKAGFEPAPSTPAALAAQMKGDIEKWGRLAKAANVKKE
jgi:tripartite-type tricarboxylate transporter receptor subunit TctC